MTIQMSKKIEDYKESFFMGFCFKDCIFGFIAFGIGLGIVLFLKSIGIQPIIGIYIAMPIVIPIGLCGFYKKDGMDFITLIKKKIKLNKNRKKIIYSSTENVDRIVILRNKENIENGFNEQMKKYKKIGYILGTVTILFIILICVLLKIK